MLCRVCNQWVPAGKFCDQCGFPLQTTKASGAPGTFLVQLFKFGISGVIAVGVSTVLFYSFKGSLPVITWTYYTWQLDVANLAYYELTSVIGGTVHFILSKVWVFGK